MVNMEDVAEYANVSTATVSRALSNSPLVSPSTKARVLAAAEKLGYQRSYVAQSLRTGKGVFVALVTGDIEHGIYPELTKLLQHELEQIELHLLLFNLDHKKERLIYLLNNAPQLGVRAIILAATTRIDKATFKPLIARVIERNVSILSLTQPIEWAQIDTIMPNNRLGIEIAVQHLLKQGRSQIAFLGKISKSYIGNERSLGYKLALKKSGIPIKKTLIWDVVTGFRSEAGYRYTTKALRKGIRINGIVAASDELAAGAISALTDFGYRIPEDVSIVGFGGTKWGYFFRPALSTIDPKIAVMSRKVRLWFEENKSTKKPTETLITPELIIRESTKLTAI